MFTFGSADFDSDFDMSDDYVVFDMRLKPKVERAFWCEKKRASAKNHIKYNINRPLVA